MIARLLCVVVAGAAAFRAAAADPPSPPPPRDPPRPSVVVEAIEKSGTRLDARLDGYLVSYALPANAEGKREIVLLIGSGPAPVRERVAQERGSEVASCDEALRSAAEAEKAPLRLVRLGPGGEGRLEELRADIPHDAHALDALDTNGDGGDELLLARTGGLWRLGRGEDGRWSAGPDLLVSDPRIDLRQIEPRIVRSPDSARDATFWLSTAGSLELYGPRPEGKGFGLIASVPLPFQPHLDFGRIRLTGPVVVRAVKRPDGSGLFATEPETLGEERLRALVIDPAAPEAERTEECWMRLPSPERLLDWAYLDVGGEPRLAVTTTTAEKLSIFGEKRFRLFSLAPDRTRSGRAPELAFETRANLWQDVRFFLRDSNADGRRDLILAYWKGIKDDTVVLDAYLSRPDGRFETSPRTTSLDVEKADRTVLDFRNDLDGDSRGDLLLLGDARVLMFPGALPSRGGQRLVEREPRWIGPLPEGLGDEGLSMIGVGSEGVVSEFASRAVGAPRPVDLDADGRAEVLLAGNEENGFARLVLYRFP